MPAGREASDRTNARSLASLRPTAPEEMKIARFVRRSAGDGEIPEAQRAELEAEAARRLAQLIPDEQKAAACDYVLTNDGAITELEWQVDQLWPILRSAAR